MPGQPHSNMLPEGCLPDGLRHPTHPLSSSSRKSLMCSHHRAESPGQFSALSFSVQTDLQSNSPVTHASGSTGGVALMCESSQGSYLSGDLIVNCFLHG